MYRFLSDASNLKAVFGSYSTLDALKVKNHIELTVRQLNIPSKALLEHMEQEGIVLSELSAQNTVLEPGSELSETVIRSHLRATFLQQEKLYAALSALNLAQQVEIRDLLNVVSSYLRLPSETLLRRMQDEGLTLDKLGVAIAKPDKVDQVRQKLMALSARDETAAGETTPHSDKSDDLTLLKQRITQLKQQSLANESAQQVGANVVSLSGVVSKLKVNS